LSPHLPKLTPHPQNAPPTPSRVQPFLRKIFEGINSLEFDGQGSVVAMSSEEGERVALDRCFGVGWLESGVGIMGEGTVS